METLKSKTLKFIAKEQGIKGWARMSKAKLVWVLQPLDIITDNLRVAKLKDVAQMRSIEGYKNMRKAELIEAIDLTQTIPETTVPIPNVTKHSKKFNFASINRLASEAFDTVMTEVNKFEDWVLSKVPELTKNKSNKNVRKRINKKIQRVEGEDKKCIRYNNQIHSKGGRNSSEWISENLQGRREERDGS